MAFIHYHYYYYHYYFLLSLKFIQAEIVTKKKKIPPKKHISKQKQSFLEEGYQNYLATSLKGSIGSSQHSASSHNSCSVLQHPTLLFYLTHSRFPALQKEFPK